MQGIDAQRPRLPRDYAGLDDAHLVAMVLAGDQQAYAHIMQCCNQRMYRVVRGVLRDDHEAEDVVQEAYVRGYEKLHTFRAEASLATWLVRIALNEAYARMRRPQPVSHDDSPELRAVAEVVAFPGHQLDSDPAESAARAQARALLERAVDALPEPFRLVYLLRDVEGCSIDETAAALGIREETVKTRLHRARRQLRQALQARFDAGLADAFGFQGERCRRITQSVLARLKGRAGHPAAFPAQADHPSQGEA